MKPGLRLSALIVLLCAMLVPAAAQVGGYDFASATGNYTEINSGIAYGPQDVNNDYIDNQIFENINLGFTFDFAGTKY
ncbi:MAG: hypothetical protein ACOCX7_04175, partial [Bacteroidota bacterium]